MPLGVHSPALVLILNRAVEVGGDDRATVVALVANVRRGRVGVAAMTSGEDLNGAPRAHDGECVGAIGCDVGSRELEPGTDAGAQLQPAVESARASSGLREGPFFDLDRISVCALKRLLCGRRFGGHDDAHRVVFVVDPEVVLGATVRGEAVAVHRRRFALLDQLQLQRLELGKRVTNRDRHEHLRPGEGRRKGSDPLVGILGEGHVERRWLLSGGAPDAAEALRPALSGARFERGHGPFELARSRGGGLVLACRRGTRRGQRCGANEHRQSNAEDGKRKRGPAVHDPPLSLLTVALLTRNVLSTGY